MRRAVLAVVVVLLIGPIDTDAQPAGGTHRIGVIPGTDRVDGAPLVEALKEGLRSLGYLEGQNVVFEYRWRETGVAVDHDRFAADLVRLKVEVIVVGTGRAALAAKRATTTIPIVIAVSPDPVREGLVASLARPGGNVTGLSFLSADLAPKQLELLKTAAPRVSRVAVLWTGAIPAHTVLLKEMERPARSLGITLHAVEARTLDDLGGAFASMGRHRANGLLVLPNSLWTAHQARLHELTAQHHLPAMYSVLSQAEGGGLMAYAADARDNWRRAAAYVDKILRGAKPGDLPIEQPAKFTLVVNLKTARALGVTIPPALLLRADRTIE